MDIRARNMLAAALTAGIGLVMASGGAAAATLQRSFVQNATGACQSALPVFDGQIRKRPLAVQNEGTAPAFVSCSFMSTDRSDAGMTEVYVYADNNTASSVDLTCTLVTGVSGLGPAFFPKTLTLPANSTINEFLWTAADNGGENFDNYTTNISCNLPVGTGLSITFVYFDEEVGVLEP